MPQEKGHREPGLWSPEPQGECETVHRKGGVGGQLTVPR